MPVMPPLWLRLKRVGEMKRHRYVQVDQIWWKEPRITQRRPAQTCQWTGCNVQVNLTPRATLWARQRSFPKESCFKIQFRMVLVLNAMLFQICLLLRVIRGGTL